jgi:cyclopropane fatty-acyl-phospholipid synthase-like methyltransferase
MRPIALSGFADKFAGDPDPWSTWTDPDEALKRDAILHALPAGRVGRMLELGAGNGSNSKALAGRALRLDATEATAEGTTLVAEAVAWRGRRARAATLVVPAPPPRGTYDVIVVAELLYYLSLRDLHALARQVRRGLRANGTLVLAHHRITFYDFAQRAEHIHAHFLNATGMAWTCRVVRQNRRWSVLACSPGSRRQPR